jgi:hypothetical protein
MYNDDCLPDARVNTPRRADRDASSETSWSLFCSAIREEMKSRRRQHRSAASSN